MDFTGRRQSTNVDDRRKNWRIYEAFRPLGTPHQTIADNQHTSAVEKRAQSIDGPKYMSDDEFWREAEMQRDLPKSGQVPSIISNLLRK
jgi:hypothetical protein